jgi:hypothetical protein
VDRRRVRDYCLSREVPERRALKNVAVVEQ